MNKTLLILFVAAVSASGSMVGQSKLSPMGRMIVSDYMEMKTLELHCSGC